MSTHFVFMSEPDEDMVLQQTKFSHITISFDAGGSGGGAYFMGFVRSLADYPELIPTIDHVTGVSAGGFAAYFLASKRSREAFRFWKRVCNPKHILRLGSIQRNITDATKEIIARHTPPITIPLTIYAKLMPSTNPRIAQPTWYDRLSSRFGFKVIEFIYWSMGIKSHDREFALTLTRGPLPEQAKSLLEKVLVGGARFLPIIMGPAVKISRTEAVAQKESAGIVHDYGMITLLGGVESLIPKYATQNGSTLHFVVVSQEQNEQFWNSLRRNKIRKLVRRYPSATVVLITAKKRLPQAWHHLPNWMSIEPWLLKDSYTIGRASGREFAERFYHILKHKGVASSTQL
jgi:hypothetical protein